jgi:GAF domain-containing protein
MGHDLRGAMTSAARAINTPLSLSGNLSLIAETARLSLPGCDAVGISTVDKEGRPRPRAGTSQLVWDLDRLQYRLQEGPCVDSMTNTGPAAVEAPRIRHDVRWPLYAPQAFERGVRAQLAVKVYLDAGGTVGGLTMYSLGTEEIHPEAAGIAALFAAHAALAVSNAREVDSLNEALRSRKAIGQAIGILMSKYTLDEDAAFGFLLRTSSLANIKIRDLAAEMVAEANAAVASPRRRRRQPS